MDNNTANNKQQRILIIGPNWLGDLVMTQVLVQRLRQLQPQAAIDIMVPAALQPLVTRMPGVSRGIASEFRSGQFAWRARASMGRSLRGQGYEQAILIPNSWKSALLPWFAKIPKRTGWLGEQRFGLLNDYRRLDKSRYPLMVQRLLALANMGDSVVAAKWPLPQLSFNPHAVSALAKRFAIRPSRQPVLMLCPGAAYGPAKRWPAKHFATLAKAQVARGWQVCLLGSVKDRELGEQIQELAGGCCINLIAKTTVDEVVDVLALATVVVSNDSGLMHVAAAVGKRLIAVYGSSSPDYTPPLTNQRDIVMDSLDCQPCFKRTCPLGHTRCLEDLLPERVMALVNKAETPASVEIV